MISLESFQLWVLFQSMITALAWKFLGFGGLVGSLLGAFIYIALFK